MKTTSKSSKKEVLTTEEVQSLLDACGGGTLGTRNRAMLALMWKTGLRRAEICDLVPADLNWKEHKIRVRQGKGGTDDFSGLPNSVRPYIDAWMAKRDLLNLPRRAPLFCSVSKGAGKPIQPAYIYNRLQALAKKAGIKKHIHPHLFRRTCATQLLNKGFSLTEVQSHLRHSSINSTFHYLKISEKDQLAQKMADNW